jgi:hypothetical protein
MELYTRKRVGEAYARQNARLRVLTHGRSSIYWRSTEKRHQFTSARLGGRDIAERLGWSLQPICGRGDPI